MCYIKDCAAIHEDKTTTTTKRNEYGFSPLRKERKEHRIVELVTHTRGFADCRCDVLKFLRESLRL
jgi:hypothetical protein